MEVVLQNTGKCQQIASRMLMACFCWHFRTTSSMAILQKILSSQLPVCLLPTSMKETPCHSGHDCRRCRPSAEVLSGRFIRALAQNMGGGEGGTLVYPPDRIEFRERDPPKKVPPATHVRKPPQGSHLYLKARAWAGRGFRAQG